MQRWLGANCARLVIGVGCVALSACGGGGGGSGSGSGSSSGGSSAPPPTISLVSNGAATPAGTPIVLTWSTTNAQTCSATGDWSGAKPTQGREVVPVGSTNVTFGLDCQGAGGSATSSVAVSVLPPRPVITLTAAATTIAIGTTTTLNWTVANATACTASGSWTGAREVSGTETTPALNANATFTLTCTGSGGSSASSVAVAARQPPRVSLWFEPETVVVGDLTRARWKAENADQCVASGSWTGARALSDTVILGPMVSGNNTFTLTCSSAVGDVSATSVLAATTPVQFVSFDFVESVRGHSSEGLMPYKGEPSVGLGTVVATLSGPVNSVTFELIDGLGQLLVAPTLTPEPQSPPGRIEYSGNIVVPTLPFRVVAKGTATDGSTFRREYSRAFRPQTMRLSLKGVPLTTDVATPIAVTVRNFGAAAQFLVKCAGQRPLRVTPAHVSVAVAAAGETVTSFDVVAVGPVAEDDALAKLSCFAAAIDGPSVGTNNVSSVMLPVEDVLTADFAP